MAHAVSILIPNYRTPDLTRLCLRLLRRHTDPVLARVIVVDNASADASTDYLRGLDWIELIERPAAESDTPSLSHARALDLAMERVDTPFVLSLHTDSLVRRADWLDFLLGEIQRAPDIAGVGSWKLEDKPAWRRSAKRLESQLQAAWYRLRHQSPPLLEGQPGFQGYLRSHCALYRTNLLRQFSLHFAAENQMAGRVIHRRLTEQGYRMRFLPSEQLSQYLLHLNHATKLLNPQLGSKPGTIRRGLGRIHHQLQALDAEQILADNSLDR